MFSKRENRSYQWVNVGNTLKSYNMIKILDKMRKLNNKKNQNLHKN